MNIQELIDKELGTPKPDRVRSGLYSPSLLGSCYRRQYYNMTGEIQSNPPDNRALRIFRVGDIFHQLIQDTLTKANFDIKVEVEVKDDLFKGFADIVTIDTVIDIKSVHSKSFWYMSKTEDIKKEKYSNWMQVALYAQLLGLNRFGLCFVSKDDLCVQEYYDTFDDFYWAGQLDEERTKLSWYKKEKTLPPAEPRLYGIDKKTNKPKECEWCSFKDTCFKLEKK
jgi:CRISPR/Cas system-associated exonuclease Cas4 (RecB family)